jgi:hypothetical protein
MSLKEQTIAQLTLDKQKSDSIINTKNQKIEIQQTLVTLSQNAIRSLTDSIFALSKRQEKQIASVISYYKSINKFEIKEVPVPYIDVLKQKKWEDSIAKSCAKVIDFYENNYISVPRIARDSTKDYKIQFTVNRNNTVLNSFTMVDTQYIRFVELKGGILKKDTYGKRHLFLGKKVQVQVLHTNKNISIIGQNSVIYKSPKKVPWLEIATILAGGIYIGTKL